MGEEHQAAATKAIEGLQAEQEKFAQQRALITKRINELRNVSTVSTHVMEKAAGTALNYAAAKSINIVAQAVGEAFKVTMAPAASELGNIVKIAAKAELRLRDALACLSWRSVCVIATVVISALIAIWLANVVSKSWQRNQIERLLLERSALEVEVRKLEGQVADLAHRGGRVQLARCGPHSRLCVQVDFAAR